MIYSLNQQKDPVDPFKTYISIDQKNAKKQMNKLFERTKTNLFK